MTKAQRNAPCPCGSGKKYKRCCLIKDVKNISEAGDKSIGMIIQYHQPVFIHYLNLLSKQIEELRTQLSNSILKSYLSLLTPPSQFESLVAASLVNLFQKKIEPEMKEILSKHHVYYWLHLYRRLAPENTFNDKSLATIYYYRNIFESAAIKFGSGAIDNDFLKGDNINTSEIMSGEYEKALDVLQIKDKYRQQIEGIYIKNFGIEDFIELLSLERLAYEFWHTTVCIRRIHKGGDLIIENEYDYWVKNSEDVEYLVTSFDQRHKGMEGLSTTSGIPIIPQKFEEKGLCFLPLYNVSRISGENLQLEELWNLDTNTTFIDNSFSPNFAWMPFDLNYYYAQHEFLSIEFKKEYSFSIESFIRSIHAIAIQAWLIGKRETGRAYQLIQRAYSHFKSLDQYIKEIEYCSSLIKVPVISQNSLTKEEILKFVEAFTLNDEMRKKIDLTTAGPRPIFIPTWGNEFLIDYAALPSTLLTAMHFLRADWTTKGVVFENHVINEVKERGLNIWKKLYELKGQDGTKIEIDLSIIFGNVMFICELRSITQSFAFLKGEREALNFRREKLERLLSECETKSTWLSTHKTGINFALPKDIVALIPVAVSPFVEYIWSKNGYYWLTERIPRICTPKELIEVINEENIATILARPYVIKVI